MSVDNGDDGRGSRTGVGQYPLPFVGPNEHAEFLDILGQIERGELEADQANRRVMAIYQMGLGAWLRSLGEIKPELVADMVRKLSTDLNGISVHYDPAGTAAAAMPEPRSVTFRFKSKNDDTLLRERVIVRALTGTNQSLASSEIHALVEQHEPDVKSAAITANLDRLSKGAAIERPRKGYYAGNSNSRAYLEALENEIEARGL